MRLISALLALAGAVVFLVSADLTAQTISPRGTYWVLWCLLGAVIFHPSEDRRS